LVAASKKIRFWHFKNRKQTFRGIKRKTASIARRPKRHESVRYGGLAPANFGMIMAVI
jgi:hypothetical protein